MGWVWFALVVASVLVFVLVARRLWRLARAAGRQVGASSRAAGAAMSPGSGPGWESRGPTMYLDEVELRAARARLRARRAVRARARMARHQETWRRWERDW